MTDRVTRPRRSCLSVPGSSPKMLSKAPGLPADEDFRTAMHDYMSLRGRLLDRLRHLVLPALTLTLLAAAGIARFQRAALLEVLPQDFVRTARAKGVSRAIVIWKHCLRNAFLPVLSYLGPAAATTLTGSFVVEKVFSIPGLGQHFVNSIQNRDRTLILGTVMVYSVFLLIFNLVPGQWTDETA